MDNRAHGSHNIQLGCRIWHNNKRAKMLISCDHSRLSCFLLCSKKGLHLLRQELTRSLFDGSMIGTNENKRGLWECIERNRKMKSHVIGIQVVFSIQVLLYFHHAIFYVVVILLIFIFSSLQNFGVQRVFIGSVDAFSCKNDIGLSALFMWLIILSSFLSMFSLIIML